MRCCRYPLLPILAGLVLVLTSALAQPPTPPVQPPKPAKPANPPVKQEPIRPPKADPAATRTFEQALEKVRRLDWVQAKVWLQMDLQGLTLPSDGRYVASLQSQKLHLVLNVNLGQVPATLEVISDGNMLWRTTQVGPEPRKLIGKVEMKKVRDSLNSPTMAPEARTAVLRELAFMGVTPLLEAIQQRMTITRKEKAAWNPRWDARVARSGKAPPEVVMLEASWSPKTVTEWLKKPSQPWTFQVPRHCQLFLDKTTGWPYRVEWWGPVQQRAGDALLLQMEFRAPRLSLADLDIPAERLAKEFDYKAGAAEAPDETAAWIRKATERNDAAKKDKQKGTRKAEANPEKR
jgi:hypothetical protein